MELPCDHRHLHVSNTCFERPVTEVRTIFANRLQSERSFGISGSPAGLPEKGCGCSSGVEHNLAKVGVEGSNPFARSICFAPEPDKKSTSRRGAECRIAGRKQQ